MICKGGLGWDDELEDGKKRDLGKWIVSLEKANTISISRCVFYHLKEEVIETWLHGFGDASKDAYCSIVGIFSV